MGKMICKHEDLSPLFSALMCTVKLEGQRWVGVGGSLGSQPSHSVSFNFSKRS